MKKTFIGIILALLFAFIVTGTASAFILDVSPPVFDSAAGTYTYTVESDGVLPVFIAWDPFFAAPPGAWDYNYCLQVGATTFECVVFGAPGIGFPNDFLIEVMEDLYFDPPTMHQDFSGDPDYSSGIILQETTPTAIRLNSFAVYSNSHMALLLGSVSLVLSGIILTWKIRKRKSVHSI